MQPKYTSSVALALAAAALAPAATADVVDGGTGNVNQIEGTVSFTAPSVLPEPITSLYIQTTSIGLTPARTAGNAATLISSTQASYDVTVLADGLTHTVGGYVRLDGNRDFYRLQSATSPAVPSDPAPAASLDLTECSGAVRVRFVDSTGNAANVDGMSSSSRSETSAGSGSYASTQASTSVSSSTHTEVYPVRGDGLMHSIFVSYSTAGIQFQKTFFEPVDCGEIVDVVVPIQGAGSLGRISGNLDLLFQDELVDSVMVAFDGPYGNSKQTTIADGYGPFEIQGLLPSSTDGLDRPYRVYGQMDFETAWGPQYFRTPVEYVFVPEGGVVDVGDTFVMEEGFLAGQVQLTGESLCIDRFTAPGATLRALARGDSSSSASNGYGYQDLILAASNRTAAEQYDTAYRLSVGTPNDVPGNWTPTFYTLNRSSDNPQSASSYTLSHPDIVAVEIAPGQTVQAPVEQCLIEVEAEIDINGELPVGTTFNSPVMSFSGGFDDSLVNYAISSGSANGFPLSTETRGTTGTVPLCLPAGEYTFDTTVSAESENGAVSSTSLRRESANMACGAKVVPFSFELEDEVCSGGDPDALSFTMTAKALGGGGRPVRAWYEINGGPDNAGSRTSLCGENGLDACENAAEFSMSFDADVSGLLQCGNHIELFVESTNGRVSESGPLPFNFEVEGPSGPGCEDVSLTLDGNPTASLDLSAVASQLNECALDEVQETVCVVWDPDLQQNVVVPVEDGTSIDLGAGVHEGQCFVWTACGPRTCAFDATVTE